MHMDTPDIIRRLELDTRVDLKLILVFLVFVSITRMILETLLGSSDYLIFTNFSTFLLVFTFYSLALVSYTFFLSICSGKKPANTARVLTPFLLVALLVPAIDYFLTGYPVSYQMSSVLDFDILRISSNNPVGESVVLWLIPVLSAIYVYMERKSIVKSLITFVIIFFVPVFLATDISNFLGLKSGLYFVYAAFASMIFVLLNFYIQNERKFGHLFMRFYERMNRIILYIIIFVFGVATAGSLFAVNILGFYILLILMVSFIAVCMNDYFDSDVDRANRKNNILDSLSKGELKNVIIISFLITVPFLSFIFESVSNVMFVYYIIAILSLIILYSYRDVIKGILPLNHIVDALSYSIVFMSGRSLLVVQGELEFVYFIVSTFIFLLLIPMKDHGDWKGDKKFGIKTLYTVLGFKKAFRLSRFFLFLAFIIFSLCYINVLPFSGPVSIIIFYLLPSILILPIMIIVFRRTGSIEKCIWLVDLLLFLYLIPFLL